LTAEPWPDRSRGAGSYVSLGALLAALWLSPALAAQTVAEVQMTPETMTLGVGQKQALFATAFDTRGNLIASAKFTFWSSDTMIAQVRKDGTVLGVKPGLAKIEARSQGKRASMAVLITGAAPGDSPSRTEAATVLMLEPASVTLFPGETVRITAQALRDNGTPVSISRATIKSLKPDIARVDSGGLITALSAGRTIVQASAGRLMATLPVEVMEAEFTVSPAKLSLSPDQSDTLRVRVPSQGNRELRGLIQWRSSDTAVASVNNNGVVRARAAGRTDIVATGFAQERRVSVTVHRVPDALVISPVQGGVVQVPLRSTRQFSAVAESEDSVPIPEARPAWELADSTVASFDTATGVLTGKALGTTTLTARLAGITPAVWTIQVVAGDIAVEPARVGLLVAQRTTLAALLRESDASGSRTAGIRWSSDRSDVASVRENGQIEAVAPGHAVVTATTPWGKKSQADIFVVGDLWLSSNRGGNYGIYQTRLTSPLQLLPVLTDNASNIQVAVAPDRTQVAFSSNRNGNYDIYVMDPDGQRLRRLTSSPAQEGEPAWTPDGSRIVYTVTSGTTPQIAITTAGGTDSRVLTTASAGNHSPSVSPDGRTIVFVSARDGNHGIYTMDLDGSNQRKLTRNSARETSPRYARNGDLLFVMERGGSSKGSKIMRMASGGSMSQLLQTEDPISSLAISRDGERLVYVTGRTRDAARGRVEFGLFIRSMATNSPPVAIPLQPGEQVVGPSF
jgi:Tol biopolymer transport system component